MLYELGNIVVVNKIMSVLDYYLIGNTKYPVVEYLNIAVGYSGFDTNRVNSITFIGLVQV